MARLCARHGALLRSQDSATIARWEAQETQLHNQLFEARSHGIPPDDLGRSYVLDAYQARRQAIAAGAGAPLHALPAFYGAVEPGIAEALARPLARLRALLPLDPPRARVSLSRTA